MWSIVAKSTGAVAGSAMDSAAEVARERATLDLLARTFDRMRAKDPNEGLGPAPPDPEGGEESS